MRLFTAVEIPNDIRARLFAITDQLRPLANLQWSPPEKLHVTTKFIGEWPEPRQAEVEAALAGVKSQPFQVAIQGIHWMTPRLLSANVVAGPELPDLASSIANIPTAIGVPIEDRPYNPHVTLARRKQRGAIPALTQALAKWQAFDFGSFTVSSFVLFQSHGGRYTPLKEYALNK